MATWLSLATIRTLTVLNVAIAAASVTWAYSKRRTSPEAVAPGPPPSVIYILSVGVLVLVVLTLNLARPVLAADPYHLDRMAQIERLGTLAYDLAAEPKVNSFSWAYELVLADIHQIPYVGGVLLRLHGLFGIAIYLLALSAARTWLLVNRGWLLVALLVVPVVFHQFVLIKNDLFGAVPAVAVLAWLIGRSADAKPGEIAWAAWLCGFAVAVKVTSAPLALVLAGALLVQRADRAAVIRAGVAGGLAGLLCGGFFFTLIENARVYGSPITAFKESGGMGNRNESIGQAAVSVVRFGISLFDLGRYTREAWPGRGGWGSTFGLPLIWAFAVLVRYRRRPEVRRTWWIAVDLHGGVCGDLYRRGHRAPFSARPRPPAHPRRRLGQRRRGPAVPHVSGRPVRGDRAFSAADRAQRHPVSLVLGVGDPVLTIGCVRTRAHRTSRSISG